MKLCPKCELNYIQDNEELCSICGQGCIAPTFNRIIRGQTYGTNSRDIYLQFCKALGWDIGQINNFGMRGQSLFARKADSKQIYDIWFICYSNLNGNTVAENGKHLNKIQNNIIAEYYEDSRFDIYPLNDRITFAKMQSHGEYEFLGVYRPKQPYSKEQGRIFIKISDNYPL